MRHAIAAAITGAGMTAATIPGGANSKAFFTGTMEQFGLAISSMILLPWARSVIGQRDIASMYIVTPRGLGNVKFDGVPGMFNM